MAKEYKVGEKYYLPVTVEKVTDGNYGVTIGFDDGAGEDTTLIGNDPDLLLTADEITEKRLGRAFSECYPTFEELKAKVAENANTISRLSANKVALTEEVGRLRETIADRTIDVQHITEENDKLKKRNKYLESEKNRKPIVHVLTNDGHVYAFTSSGKASVKYHTELNILMIEDGEKTIAGFSRGDKPGNLSAWWMG